MSSSLEQVCRIVAAKTVGAEKIQLLRVVKGLKQPDLQDFDPEYVTEDDVIDFLRSKLPGMPGVPASTGKTSAACCSPCRRMAAT